MVHTIDADAVTALRGDLILRRQTPGPEIVLVNNYVNTYFPAAPQGHCRSIFIEPRIESGFPDVVIVEWHMATAETWQPNRVNLKKSDIRILHYLYTHGATPTDDLKTLFLPHVEKSLTRLHDADVIACLKGTWRAKSLTKIFAVRKLIAIEAKMAMWRQGLQQAIQNTWFASESYLLLPTLPRNSKLMEQASSCGVGVITSQHSINNSIVSAKKEKIPSSYASWLFNEWAWRASLN